MIIYFDFVYTLNIFWVYFLYGATKMLQSIFSIEYIAHNRV